MTTLYTQHKSNAHFTCTFYCQDSPTPPAQDSPRIFPNSQLEQITKPYGMPTKPQEILKYPATSNPLPFRQNNSLSCQSSLSVHLRPDNMCCRECETPCGWALRDMCSSHRFGIKGDPSGEGNVTQAWKGEKGRAIQGVSIRENKTRVQFPLHVAPTPPGSGVFFSPLGMFTECISNAFTRIWGQFAPNSVNSLSGFW